jgi:hypothetical protein
VCARGELDIMFHPEGLRMTPEEWRAIAPLLRPSMFDGSAWLGACFALSHEELGRLPLRIYLGTNEGRELHLRWPVDFHRVNGKLQAILTDRGVDWRVRVDLTVRTVEVVRFEGPSQYLR